MQLRKIPFIALLFFLAFSLVAMTNARPKKPAPPQARSLSGAQVIQKGRSLVLVARSTRAINLSRLSRFPSRAGRDARYLCFLIAPSKRSSDSRRICLGSHNKSRPAAGLTIANAAGRVVRTATVPATMKRPQPNRIVVTLKPEDLGLRPGMYSWQLTGRFDGALCPAPRSRTGCSITLPGPKSWTQFEVRAARPVGCTTGAAGLVTRGPRTQKLVALTFDDGPGPYTEGFLKVLRDKQVPSTFFVLGQLVATYPDLARRIVNEGHEIANHSWKHDLYPSAADLRQTSSTIQSVTGFKPCSFRPPGGARNASVIAGAGSAGMKTIIWDVDPFDWRLPGTDAIRRTVLAQTRPGSIVLSHDAGGPRAQTLAALPGIIDRLRARGYRFTTVTELLGGRIQYRIG